MGLGRSSLQIMKRRDAVESTPKTFTHKMGDDNAEHPPRQHGGRAHYFPEGSRVEVLSDDDDMGGVYFSATVIHQRPLCARRTKKTDRLHVKYTDLLASEDRPDRLEEYVDISSVRPSPPSLAVAKPLAANDVVNAFYNDGWWKGIIVSRVVGVGDGDGERFVVIFEKPPDVREFRASDLRPHWDWVDGVWAGLQNVGDAVFILGEKVEVSFEGDDAWFPAVIARDLENGRYLVEFMDKNGSLVKGEVDCGNVRPSPPVLEERVFAVSERVEAFFDSRWLSGLIMEKKVKDDKNGCNYSVFFENLKLEKVFDVLQVRAHMDWKDGKWFVACSLTSISDTPSPSSTKRKKRSDLKRSDFKGCASLKKHKGENKHANQETEPLPVEKIVSVEEKGENELANQETEPLPIEKIVSVEEKGESEHADQETEPLPIEEIVSVEEKGEIEHADQETEPLPIEKIVSVEKNIDGSNLEAQSLVSSVSIDEGSVTPKEVLPDSGWPFVKHSILWKSIESMDVLRKTPQKPHFQPLSHLKEPEREGLAIGFMVTLSDVVERSSSLKIGEPKRVVEDLIEELNPTLVKLEDHGFDLGMVRGRMMKLLEAKDIEEKLAELRCEKSKIDGEIQVMKEGFRKLQEQLKLAQIDSANQFKQIANLHAKLGQIQQQIDDQQ